MACILQTISQNDNSWIVHRTLLDASTNCIQKCSRPPRLIYINCQVLNLLNGLILVDLLVLVVKKDERHCSTQGLLARQKRIVSTNSIIPAAFHRTGTVKEKDTIHFLMYWRPVFLSGVIRT